MSDLFEIVHLAISNRSGKLRKYVHEKDTIRIGTLDPYYSKTVRDDRGNNMLHKFERPHSIQRDGKRLKQNKVNDENMLEISERIKLYTQNRKIPLRHQIMEQLM